MIGRMYEGVGGGGVEGFGFYGIFTLGGGGGGYRSWLIF